jgi:2-octaprenylphenol hydroxylase
VDKSNHDFDIVIVGAGMVGSALACALGGSGLSVAVIEAQVPLDEWLEQNDTIAGFDTRVSALTLAAQKFLQQLGVWSAIVERRISAYQRMHVWDAEGTGSISFAAQEINQPALGHIVENRLTATALWKKMQQHKNLQIIAPAKLSALTPIKNNSYSIMLEDGRQLQAGLVVAADGGYSKVRSLAQFAVREWDYGQHAIVATVETSLPHQQTAWQRFLPAGPLAFLPLQTRAGTEQLCSIVWSVLPDYAEHLMGLNDKAFADCLADAFEHRLGDITAVSRRFSFPLRQRHAVDYIKPGLALVGDAAHTIHPLAGQGVNLGLMDAQVLSEELLRAKRRQLEVGSAAVLQRYQRRRKAANLGMMAAMEAFKQLFAAPTLPLRWIRNSGMRWLDKALPLKRKIIRQAMGL